MADEVIPAANEYDEAVRELADTRHQSLSHSFTAAAAAGLGPDQQARVLDLSKRHNLPADIVARNLPDIERQEATRPPDFEALATDAPGLAKWLEDPANAALAQDDLAPLKRLDRGTSVMLAREKPPAAASFAMELGRAALTGWTDLHASAWNMAAMYGLQNPYEAAEKIAAANKKTAELRAKAPDYAREFSTAMQAEGGDVNRAWKRFTGSYEKAKDGHILEALKDYHVGGATTIGQALDMIGAAVIRPRGVMHSGAENLAFSAPALVLSATGGGAGGLVTGPLAPLAVPVGMAGGAFVGSAGSEIGAWMSQAMAKRPGFDPTNPAHIAAAFEDPAFMAEARGEAERKGLTTAAVDAAFSAFGGKILAKGAGAGKLAKAGYAAADVAVQAGGETFGEAAGQAAAKKSIKGIDVGDSILEGIVSLGRSVGDTAIGAVYNRAAYHAKTVIAAQEVAAQAKAAVEAQKAAQAMQDVGEAVAEAKTTKRHPDAIRQVVAAAAEGSDAGTVYFQTETWDEYWQGKGIPPAKAAGDLMGDGGRAYTEAKQKGHQLEVSAADYIGKMAPTEHWAGLLPSARVKPDGMTLTEATDFLKGLPGLMNELAEEAVGKGVAATPEEKATKESSAKVKTAVTDMLVAAKTPRPEAERLGQLWQRHMTARAARLGADPFSLFQKMGLEITRPTEKQPINAEAVVEALAAGDLQGIAQALTPKDVPVPESDATDVEGGDTSFDFGENMAEAAAVGSSDPAYAEFLRDESQLAELEHLQNTGGLTPVLDAIRANGGIDMQKLKENGRMGELEDLHWTQIFTTKGKTLDGMAEALAQDQEGGPKLKERDINLLVESIKEEAAKISAYKAKYGDKAYQYLRRTLRQDAIRKDDESDASKDDKPSQSERPAPGEGASQTPASTQAPALSSSLGSLDKSLTDQAPNFKSLFGETPLTGTAEMLRGELRGIVAKGKTEKQAIAERLKDLDGTTAVLVGGAAEVAASPFPVTTKAKILASLTREAERRLMLKGEQPTAEVLAAHEALRAAVNAKTLEQSEKPNAPTFFSKLARVTEGDTVSGLIVRKDIPNTNSIAASLDDYEVLGVREVPFSIFGPKPKNKRYYSVALEKRVKALAAEIKESGEINPLIVVMSPSGPYILEGAHRFDALDDLGLKSFPALVVQEERTLEQSARIRKSASTITQPQSFREQADDYLGREMATMTPLKVMDAPMLTAIENDQVHRAVVEAIPVDVVDILTKNGLSANDLVSQPNMVWKALPVNSRSSVARGLADALSLVGAGLRAALDRVLASDAAGGDQELFSAIRASDLDPGEIVGLLSPQRIYGFDGGATLESTRGTPAGTKQAIPSKKNAGISGEATTAQITRLINWHDGILANRLDEAQHYSPGDLFQDEDAPAGARGRLRFGPDSGNPNFTIELFKTADRSTFIHESGHVFLEELRQDAAAVATIPAEQQTAAQRQLLADWDTATAWMGVEGSYKAQGRISTAQHEQWARGIEAYLFEGKAPSAQLRAAFRRFKAWLIQVYGDINALKVELSPEIRGVFDRLVATQQEIAEAQAEMQHAPLFTDPASAGLDTKAMEGYMAAVEESKAAAEEELGAKVLERIRREEEAWWKEERASVRTDIAAELAQRPEQIALAALQSERLPDGQEYPEGTLPPKLDRAAIPPDVLATLPRGVTTATEGAHPDVLAGIFGYQNGGELLLALQNTMPFKQAVETATDEIMAARHGDVLRDVEQLQDEAMKAIHTEKHAEVLRAEIAHLASNSFAAFKGLAKKIMGRVPTLEAARMEAGKAIGHRKVSEIRPGLFKVAEAKAAREARDLFLAGDIQGAFDAKRRQLANHELYRAAAIAKEQIDRALDRFRRMSRKDEKLAKTRDVDLINAARAILASFGLDRTEKPAAEYLAQLKNFDPEMYETVNELVSAATHSAAPWRDISVDDFSAMAESVDALWDLSLRTQQIRIDGIVMEKKDAVRALESRLSELGLPDSLPGYKRALTKWEKVQMHLLGARAALRRVESWVDAADESSPAGVFRKYLWNPIAEATAAYRVEKRTVLQKYLGLLDQLKGTLHHHDIAAPEIGYTFSSKAELLHAMLHTGNESNLSKLLRGRGWGDYDAMGELDASKWAAFVKRMHSPLAAQGPAVLTKADYDFLQATWDLLETLKPAAQQAHKEMYGYYFGEISAQPFVTPFGSYNGGYVPAITDPYIVREADIRNEREALEKSNNSFMFPTAGRGFTKKRVEGYAKPLLLDLGLLASHIDKVLRFTHIEPRVKDVGRIVMDRGFRATLDAFDPAVGGDMLVPWLQRAAQQNISTPSQGLGGRALDKFFSELRRRTGLQVMTANLTNAFQQFTGISIAAVKVKPKHLRNALWTYTRAPKATAAAAAAASKFMDTRTTTSTFEIQNQLEELLLDPTKFEQARAFAQKHGYVLQAGAQNIVDTVVWTGAYEQAVEGGADEKAAVREADAAVRATQGSFNPEDVSRFETGSPLARAFTMFYSYFNMQANLLGTEFSNIQRQGGLKKGAGRALYVYTLGFMIPAFLSELITRAMSGNLDEDDDDQILDDVAGAFFFGQFRSATALFPIVGPIVSAGINAWNDKWYDDRITTSPAVAMIESSVQAPRTVYKAAFEGGSKKKATRDFLTLMGMLSGLPVAPIGRPLGYLADLEEGKIKEPAGPIDLARGLLTGRGARR